MLVKVFRVLSVREGDPFSTMLLVVLRVFSDSGDGLKSMLFVWLIGEIKTMLGMILRFSSGVEIKTMLGMILRLSSGGGDAILTMLVMVLRVVSGVGGGLEAMLGMELRNFSGGWGVL